MCSVSIILGPGSLGTTFKDSFATRQLPLNVLLHYLCGIRVLVSAYTVPSFNISVLSPYCYNSKIDNEDDVESYTPPRNDQVHKVRSLNTSGEGVNTYLSTDNNHGTNTNCKDMLSVCKCPR
jgi:hypothetical protein